MNRNYFSLLFLAILFFHQSPAQTNDSLTDSTEKISPSKNILSDYFLATSLFINSNWKENYNTNITFFGSIHLVKNKNTFDRKTIREFRGELGYLKSSDSIWLKTADKVFLSSIWILNNNNGFKHSFSANIKTQFTNTWESSYSLKDARRIWKSGPLMPLTLTIGYGTTLTFENESYINFSIAALKFRSVPGSEDFFPEIKTVARSEKFLIKSEYGINVQWLLRKKITDNFLWENKLSFFTRTFDHKGSSLDVQNTFALIPLRHIKLNLVNKLAYDYLISQKMQYRFEMLLGYSFGKK